MVAWLPVPFEAELAALLTRCRREGIIPPVREVECEIQHADGCLIERSPFCSCVPDIVVVIYPLSREVRRG